MLAFLLGRCFVVLLKQWIHQEFGQLKGFLQLVQKWDFEFSTFSFYKCVQLFELFDVWDSQWLMWLKTERSDSLEGKGVAQLLLYLQLACISLTFYSEWLRFCTAYQLQLKNALQHCLFGLVRFYPGYFSFILKHEADEITVAYFYMHTVRWKSIWRSFAVF